MNSLIVRLTTETVVIDISFLGTIRTYGHSRSRVPANRRLAVLDTKGSILSAGILAEVYGCMAIEDEG